MDSQDARILVIDDEPDIVEFVSEGLRRRGFKVEGISDPQLARDRFKSFSPQVCIMDITMPHFTGEDLFGVFKHIDPSVEILFLTGLQDTSQAVDLMKRGAADYLLKPIELSQLNNAAKKAFDHYRLVKENEMYRHRLEVLVENKTAELKEALQRLSSFHEATLGALALALDYRDNGTSGHSRRVARFTKGIAECCGISGEDLTQIEHGALLHDIGKLKIPDSILFKPGSLTQDEWLHMKQHVQYGHEFLQEFPFLKAAASLVLTHHEKYDGTGYPNGIKGTNIPIGARIFAIVDTVDAMMFKRPYNNPVSFEEAAKEVHRCAGTQFDPALVEPALGYLRKYLVR